MYAYHPEVAHQIEMEHLKDYRREANQARLLRMAPMAEGTRIRILRIIRRTWARLSRSAIVRTGLEPSPRTAWQE